MNPFNKNQNPFAASGSGQNPVSGAGNNRRFAGGFRPQNAQAAQPVSNHSNQNNSFLGRTPKVNLDRLDNLRNDTSNIFGGEETSAQPQMVNANPASRRIIDGIRQELATQSTPNYDFNVPVNKNPQRTNYYNPNQNVDTAFRSRSQVHSRAQSIGSQPQNNLNNSHNFGQNPQNRGGYMPQGMEMEALMQAQDYPQEFYGRNNTNGRQQLALYGAGAQNPNKQPFDWNAQGQLYGSAKKPNRIYAVTLVALFLSAAVFTFAFNTYQQQSNRAEVAGATEVVSSSKSDSDKEIPVIEVKKEEAEKDSYASWIKERNNNEDSPENKDLDEDGLTNGEEFLLNTNPVSAHTCDAAKTDTENLVDLVDPASCQAIDVNNKEVVEKFSQFVNIPEIQEKFTKELEEKKTELTEVIEQKAPEQAVEQKPEQVVEQKAEAKSSTPVEQKVEEKKIENQPVLEVLEVKEEFRAAQAAQLPAQTEQTVVQEEAQTPALDSGEKATAERARLIQKTEQYIQKYRSYETYDNNYESPVAASVYLDVAEKYQIPLRYMLALARSESRFGTDRYDSYGNLTRPGQYQNIYSIGLDDSGNNAGYSTWEAGVEGFGRWYQKYHNQGVSDCRKWRIYNPNGDYCAKIEALANEIQFFLDR